MCVDDTMRFVKRPGTPEIDIALGIRIHEPEREETCRQQFRFRKNPPAYLVALEAQLLT